LCHHTLQVMIHKLDLSKTKTALLILIKKSLDENTNSPNYFSRNRKYEFHKSPLHGNFFIYTRLSSKHGNQNCLILLYLSSIFVLFCFPNFFNGGEH
jgi:hypothetical protein